MTVNEAKEILQSGNRTEIERFALQFMAIQLDSRPESLPSEIWRDVVDEEIDYEGKYQVSNFARVRSLKRKVKIIKPDIIHTGYSRITLYKDDKKKRIYVHVLVARAFIPNPENKPEVDHIDTNKFNNHLFNLRWVTGSENIRHAFEMGVSKSGCEHGQAKFTAEQVREIRRDCVPGDPERGFKAFARKFNVTHRIISDAYYGRSYKDVK